MLAKHLLTVCTPFASTGSEIAASLSPFGNTN
jgi:hypothetical protein